MSGQQWELVTKNKKEKANGGAPRKLTKTEKKKFAENAPKVEDLLPMSQVKTLYSELTDVKKANSEAKAKSKESDAKKQQQKKLQLQQQQQQQQQKGDKVKEKENKPKTLDAAMSKILPEDFKNSVASFQAKFDRTPLLWLRSLDSYFDAMLNVEISDPVFSSKNHEYPLCLMPAPIRSTLTETLTLAGEANLQIYFEILLTNLAQEMTKGMHAVGTRLLLQFVATSYPTIAVNAIPKCLSLHNSYKNRKPIWLSLMWAMGQAGFRDLSVGLKVWQEIMLPVLDQRNYSQFAVEYLTRLLGRHAAGPALSVNQYLNALDAIYKPNVSVTNHVTDALHRQARVLRKIAVNATPDAKLNLFFQPLVKMLERSDTDAYKEEILEFLYLCICIDEQCFAVWKQIYPNNLVESAALLQHIESKWESSGSKVAQKPFKALLQFFIKSNASLLSSKPKSRSLKNCEELCLVRQFLSELQKHCVLLNVTSLEGFLD